MDVREHRRGHRNRLDRPNARVVFYFDPSTGSDYLLAPKDETYTDATAAAGTGAETYPFGLDLWLAGESPYDVIRNPVAFMIADRPSAATQAQTMTALVTGQPAFDETPRVGYVRSLAPAWGAGSYEGIEFGAGVSGKVIHWSFRNQDAYGLDLLELQYGGKAGAASEKHDG